MLQKRKPVARIFHEHFCNQIVAGASRLRKQSLDGETLAWMTCGFMAAPLVGVFLHWAVLTAQEPGISKVKLGKMLDQPELHQVNILDGQLPFSPSDLLPKFK
jgi:hypothetical protein